MKFGGQVSLDLSYNHPLYAAMRDYSGDVSGPFTRRGWALPGDWKISYRSVTPLLAHAGEEDSLTESEFYQNSKMGHSLLKEWALDKEAARLLGRFLADGHARRSSTGYTMEMAFHERDVEAADRFVCYLKRLGVAVRREPFWGGQLGFKIIWSSKLMWHALRECYDDLSEKRLPSWGYRLGEHLPLVLEEWLAGDGWRHEKRTVTIGTTTSRRLAIEMRDISVASGRAATIQRLQRSRYGKPNKDQFHVYVHDAWPQTAHLRMVSEREAASRCQKHETYQYDGDVYNLQVAEDRSFIAEGIVVHNCVISLALAWSCLDSEYAENWGSQVWGLVTCGLCGRMYRDEPKGKPCSHCGHVPPRLNGNGEEPMVQVVYR